MNKKELRSLKVSIETLKNRGVLRQEDEARLKKCLKSLDHALSVGKRNDIRATIDKIARTIVNSIGG